YLLLNFAHTGHFAGQRVPGGESTSTLLGALVGALTAQLNLVTYYIGSSLTSRLVYASGYILSCVFIAIFCGKAFMHLRHTVQYLPVLAFGWSAIIYLALLIALRWNFYFDIFDDRLLFPFVLMLLFSAIVTMSMQKVSFRMPLALFATIAFTSALYNGAML